MKREWREASDMRPSVAGLAIILAVAAVLRFWGLGSGIPFAIGIDEPQIMSRVLRMMNSGDFNPHFFDYPGLYLYVQLLVGCARFLFGVFNGSWHALNQVNATELLLWGRAVTALAGTATVYLVFLIGTRWGARHALLAAGIMAVMPMHVRESHYVLTDVPMTFFVALSFLLTLRAMEARTLRAFAWAGLAAGLATATKYYGGVVLMVPLVAAFLVTGVQRSRTALVLSVIGSAVGGFLLFAPYTVLDLPGFLNGFGALATSFHGGQPAEPAWITYMKHLRIAIWWPGMLLLAWGTTHAIVRAITGPGKERFLLLAAFPALYFALVGTRTSVFARYLMPMVPFITLLIAIAIVSGVTFLRRFSIPRPARTALIVALTVVAIVPSAIGAIGFDRMLSQRSTGQAAYEWVVGNVPRGSRVAVEMPTFELPGTRYRLTAMPAATEEKATLCTSGSVDYVVTSSDAFGRYLSGPFAFPEEASAYTRLFGSMALAASFRPSAMLQGSELRIYRCQSMGPDANTVNETPVKPTEKVGKRHS